MNEQPSTILIVLAFVIGFPLFWIAVTYTVSHFSGWAALARQYPATAEPTGQSFNWCSGKISFFSSYKNCIIATVSESGLHLATMLFFRAGHNPIFIPWSALQGRRRSQFLFSTVTRMNFGDGQSIVLYGTKLADAIEKYAPEITR